MRLTFLGTGTSTGIPMLGCGCAVCTSDDTRDRRLRTSALLTTDCGQNILIDCGPDFRTQMLTRARHTRPDAILITHTHYDHTGGLDDVRPYCTPEPLDIYCSRYDNDVIHRNMPYCFGPAPYPGSPRIELHTVIPGRPFEAAGVTVMPLDIRHGQLDILGYRIGPLAYITDASYVPPDSMELLKGVDTLVLNALRLDPHPSHMNLREALDVIETIRPHRAYLTHIAHNMPPHRQCLTLLPDGVSPAYDGLTIDI